MRPPRAPHRLRRIAGHLSGASAGRGQSAGFAACSSARAGDGQAEAAAAPLEVLIVGAGFSGLLCAVALDDVGVPRDGVAVLEAGRGCGGVWRSDGVGNYPGAACDLEAYSYLPLLERVGFVPSKKFVTQKEIQDYAGLLAERLDILPRIRFETFVTGIRHLEGQEEAAIWAVDIEKHGRAETMYARHVVVAVGPLSSPRMPEVAGMGTFRGPTMHTARWDHGMSLRGKRVGVVGTGASAGQVITTIADEVQHLYVFQRSACWVAPRQDEPTPEELRRELTSAGGAEQRRLAQQEGADTVMYTQLNDPAENKVLQEQLKRFIKKQVPNEELRAKLTPDYPLFCKRILVLDDYYSTFMKPNVSLVAEPGGVQRETPRGLVVSSGKEYELDAIVYATGFVAMTIRIPITGRGGLTLEGKWGGEDLPKPKTLFGIHTADFPNLYIMMGPQSVNPISNYTFVCEDQARYIATLVSHMRRAGLRTVEPRREAEEAWTRRTLASTEGKLWRGCTNWYTRSGPGREPFYSMWMDPHTAYMAEGPGREVGAAFERLEFSS